MGRVCAAVNCTSRQKKDSGISFHEFPHKRPEVLKKWLQNVRREKWFPREKSSFLCSEHFLPDCFEGGRQTLRRLRDDAVPTIFDYTVKSRKRRLSTMARVKRLATSTSSVITSSVERNWSQKSASKVKPQQKNKQSTVQLLTDDTTNKGNRRSLRNIENRLIPLRKSRMLHRKKYTYTRIQHEEEEEGQDLNLDEKIPLSVEENPSKHNVRRAANNKTAQVNSDLHQATTGGSSSESSFQTITIVPMVTSGNGEVCYRLIVQDCDDNDSNTAVSMDTLNTKNEPSSSKIPDNAGQRLPSNRVGDKDDNQLMKCTYCKYVTRKRYLLSRHLKAHLERHPHQCDQCPLSFKTLLALQNHVNTHRGVRPFRCRRCDDQFTTSGELVTHMQNSHEESREVSLRSEVKGCRLSVPYFCPLCSFIGSDAWSLKRHLVVHSAEKLYECDVCDVRFDNRKQLEVHKNIHLLDSVYN